MGGKDRCKCRFIFIMEVLTNQPKTCETRSYNETNMNCGFKVKPSEQYNAVAHKKTNSNYSKMLDNEILKTGG